VTGAHTAWLGLGSNLGDRERNLARAIAGLRALLDLEALSPVYETEPYGYADQPRFLNMAVRARTDLPPAELLRRVKDVERAAGRTATFCMGPRVIDIDILLYDALIMDDGVLVLPHPGLSVRAFVLAPLLDLDPALRHPVSGMALADHLAGIGRSGVRRCGAAEDVLPAAVRG
jgi:2-amino-4-hydroxy-6-hydroxymethyldihydropteridine diphosphokinase